MVCSMNLVFSYFVFAVSFRNIQSVPFPAVTVCPPGTGKWPAIVEALSQVDKDDTIVETIQLFEENFKFFSKQFNDYIKAQWTMLVTGVVWPRSRSTLDHEIPTVLNLLPIERDVFYLIHFACYAMGKKCKDEITSQSDSLALKSILLNNTREKTAEEIKEMICNKVNCSITSDSNWMNCNNDDTNLMYQEWCKKCPDLSGCLHSRSGHGDVYMVSDIVSIFYAWRKFFTKKNFIHALLTMMLDESYQLSYTEKMRRKLWTKRYIKGITPFPKSNLTLLDAWSYAYGDVFEGSDVYSSNSIDALKSCLLAKDESNCLLVEQFNQELGNQNLKLWKGIQQSLTNDFIPLCSYGATNIELNHCKAFKRIDQGHCFTFNESSFAHILGKTQGINFLVNYDFPGTELDMSTPFAITLHEPNQDPDIKNIKGKNFFVRPGRMVDLKITTTVVDSTADFDAMSFESRLCNKGTQYGELNCLMEHIIDQVESKCGCQPWYIKDMNNASKCNTLGTICYETLMKNGTENLIGHGKCFEACQEFKYSLVLLEDLPMTDALKYYKSPNIEYFGDGFNNLFQRPEKLIQYRGFKTFYSPKAFLEEKLKRATLVHLNFEELKVFTITKDAKITIPDMIGNIGGTLGVFIGFSFLGLLDDLIEFFQNLYRRQN